MKYSAWKEFIYNHVLINVYFVLLRQAHVASRAFVKHFCYQPIQKIVNNILCGQQLLFILGESVSRYCGTRPIKWCLLTAMTEAGQRQSQLQSTGKNISNSSRAITR